MSNTLNYFLTQIASTSSFKNADLSELDLIKINPIIGYTLGIFFLIGVFIDAYIVRRMIQGDDVFGNIRSALSQVLPWNLDYRELVRIFAVIIMTLLTGGILAALAGGQGAIEDGTETAYLLGVEMVLRLGLFAWLILWIRGKGMSLQRMTGTLKFRTICRTLGMGIVGFLAVLPPLMVVLALYSTIAESFGFDQSPQPIVEWFLNADSLKFRFLLGCLAVIVAPIFEEVLFRGIAYPVLKHHLGMGKALLIVSVIFALIHFHIGSFMPLFVLAIAFTFAYEHTGSLLTPILMHSVFNAVNVAALVYRSRL